MSLDLPMCFSSCFSASFSLLSALRLSVWYMWYVFMTCENKPQLYQWVSETDSSTDHNAIDMTEMFHLNSSYSLTYQSVFCYFEVLRWIRCVMRCIFKLWLLVITDPFFISLAAAVEYYGVTTLIASKVAVKHLRQNNSRNPLIQEHN